MSQFLFVIYLNHGLPILLCYSLPVGSSIAIMQTQTHLDFLALETRLGAQFLRHYQLLYCYLCISKLCMGGYNTRLGTFLVCSRSLAINVCIHWISYDKRFYRRLM